MQACSLTTTAPATGNIPQPATSTTDDAPPTITSALPAATSEAAGDFTSPLLQLPPQLLVALAAACSSATRKQLRAACRELRTAANSATHGLGLWLCPDADLARALVHACSETLLALDARSLKPGHSLSGRWAAVLPAAVAALFI
jgi:hypothetical protein